MNIYDFDGTIYDGDSSVDFFKFALKRDIRCIKTLPGFAVTAVLYLLNQVDKEQLKSSFFRFVSCFDDVDAVVEDFWVKHQGKIKSFYIAQKSNDDIIISASPEFLLLPICERLGVSLIGSKVDSKTGFFLGKNCYGEEKVVRLREITSECCDKFYSDSHNDLPLRKLAREAYMVKGNIVVPWKIE